jgi:hypothetical protein
MDSGCFIYVNITLVIVLYQRTPRPAQWLAVDNEHGLTCFNYQLNAQFIYSIKMYITLL